MHDKTTRGGAGEAGMASDQELSPRVRAAIRHEQAASEVLLSWVQLGFLGFMTFLYFIAPKGFNRGGMEVIFEPIPLMLLFYTPCILVRFILTLRQRLTPFILSLSVLVDIAFILGLIFSFHIQYHQPAAFYLKAPTFCYLFIFIVLRSLRYEIRYLLIAGSAAIVGWGILVGIALWDNGIITRNYTEYITSTKILIGAEVDKMISLAVLTIILSIGVSRARQMLSRSEAESLAKKDLARFFSPDVARKIIYSDERIKPGQGEICHAVALMMDLRGFTTLSATLAPNEVMQLLADYQARMVPRILEHAGCVDKFLGDGILAHFGAAMPSPAYAASALQAAESLVITAHAWSEERAQHGLPRIRVGVACAVSDMIFGAVGDAERLEFTVIGDAVNLSAKLEKHTKVAMVDILTTRELFELALRQGYTPTLTPVHLDQEAVEGIAGRLDLVGFRRIPLQETLQSQRHMATNAIVEHKV
jgi:adenylate cyclase